MTNDPKQIGQSAQSSASALRATEASPPTQPMETCWNIIGVYGDGRCPELRQFIHCRNCPVYSRAGLALLDRPLSAEYREEWSAHFAREKQSSPPGRISTVLFRTESEWFALPTHAFQEVAEQRQIHSLPHRRQGVVVGLANIRGELVICASLNRLLGLEKSSPDDGQQTAFKRLLVVSW